MTRETYTMWTTRDGRQIALNVMSRGHLENLFGYLERGLQQNPPGRRRQLVIGRWLQAINAELWCFGYRSCISAATGTGAS